MTHALEVADLVVTFGTTTAVAGATWHAPTGKVTALLGPNGAGKSTTLSVAEGRSVASSGRVNVLGQDPRDRDLRPKVGVLLQAGGVYPSATADTTLKYLAALYANPIDPDDLIEMFDLSRVRRTPCRRLSGGEQQRLRLAMAIIGRPELVILDEPTTGLDPLARGHVWDIIAQLRQSGATVILSTHLLDEAERLADHIVVMSRGTVVASGTLADLTNGDQDSVTFKGPLHLDRQSLVGALPAGCDVIEGPPGTYRLTGGSDPRILATLTAWCAQHGVAARDIQVGQGTLEAVFSALVTDGNA